MLISAKRRIVVGMLICLMMITSLGSLSYFANNTAAPEERQGSNGNETEPDQPTNVGVIVGASVGGAAGVGIGTAGLVIFIRRRRLR